MNLKSILYIQGWIVLAEGVLMLLPVLVALIYGETSGYTFLWCALGCLLLGCALTRRHSKITSFSLKDGYVSVALGWVIMSAIGALPFALSGEIPSYLDSVFEIVSGFTTTGASILPNVEALSHCMLFWRSFSHWIGGMGVLVFILMILPKVSSGSTFSLMQAESPGPSVSKLVPTLRATARYLYLIYIGLSLLQLIFLIAGKMPPFDSFCIMFGTMGTGGFAPLNSSIASYSPYLQWVVIVFMMLAGTNFTAFFLILFRQIGNALKMEELRWYYAIILFSTALVSLNLWHAGLFSSIREGMFQVVSIMTTTGFATTDFNLWPNFSHVVLVTLMFIGACAGSTGGGIKVSRLVIYGKAAAREVRSLTRPRSVRSLRMDGKKLEDSTVRGALLFLVCYFMVFFVSWLIVSWDGDFSTSFTAVAATINNIGPGISLVGPTSNYAFFSPLSKIVLIFDMLCGRLEIFPMLILFSPRTWKGTVKRQ